MGQSSMEEYFPSMCAVLYSSIINTKQTKTTATVDYGTMIANFIIIFVLEKEGYTNSLGLESV